MKRTVIPVLVAMLLLLCSISAAQRTKKTKKTNADQQAEQSQIQEAIEKLKSPNPEEIVMSVQMLTLSGSKEAATALETLLRSGPRNDITDMTIQALGAISSETSIDILLPYVNHRRSDARIAAIFALENFSNPRVKNALEKKLRDSNGEVRASAALALGKAGDAQTISVLFTAFDMGVHEAIISIGKIGSPKDAERAADYLGKFDIKVLLPGFEQFLLRDDIPEKEKLQILDRLFELAGPEVKKFAKSIKASFPPETKESENPVFKKVSQMVRQIAEN